MIPMLPTANDSDSYSRVHPAARKVGSVCLFSIKLETFHVGDASAGAETPLFLVGIL
jgi:hypothetical protein